MEKRRFTIPQVTDKTLKKEEPINVNGGKKTIIDKSEQFVSTMYGTNVKDVNYYPQAEFNNQGKQYRFLDNDGKVTPEDYKDYCVPKQEEFYGYGPTNGNNNQNKDEVIKTYEGANVNNNVNNNNVNNNNANNNNVNIANQNNVYDNQAKPQEDPYASLRNNPNYNQDYTAPNSGYNTANGGYPDPVRPMQNNNANNPYSEMAKQVVNPMSGRERIDDFTEEEQPQVSNEPIKSKCAEKYDGLQKERKTPYKFPSLSLLKRKNPHAVGNNDGVDVQAEIINRTLQEFDISGQVVGFQKGPTVTLFEVKLNPGVMYTKVTRIEKNLQGNLAALNIRVFAPIPGKSTVGIEVPNIERDNVYFGDMIANEAFYKDGNPMNVILGIDISNENQYVNIVNMPHCLIAGCTKSGKSVCVNSILMSIIYKAHPDDVKLILIDPKKVEFMKYNGLPHLATPVITDAKLAIATMKWLVDEMENRYDYLASIGVTNFQEYLELQKNSVDAKHIPYLVLVIDEFADLMQTGGHEVEEIVQRLTQKARAAGIHLIIATQRPSVDVISGTIKSNIPTRIAFKVQKPMDSTIILDKTGAEKLLGNGDMLYYNDMGKECRIQGAYITTDEVKAVVNSISTGNMKFVFTPEDVQAKIESEDNDDVIHDPKFVDVARYVVRNQTASINRIQQDFNCGYNRIKAMIEKLAELGVVGENLGSRARNVLMEENELEYVLADLGLIR